jgi:serine/threonine protein kinase
LDLDDREPVAGAEPRAGAYGRVRKVRHKVTGEVSALKELFMKNEAGRDAFIREVDLLRQILHPAIVGIIGIIMPQMIPGRPDDETPPIIVTEWLARGSLEDSLSNSARWARLTPTMKAKIAVGIALGMRYMHSCGVMHRDLKPANILLDWQYEVRIADLGSARAVDLLSTLTQSIGTPIYMAPEIMDGDYDQSSDVYSYAIMLWEILSGTQVARVFTKLIKSPLGWINKVKEDNLRPALTGLEPMIVTLLESIWHGTPSHRMSFDQIVAYFRNHKYQMFPGVIESEVESYATRLEEYERKHPPVKLDV